MNDWGNYTDWEKNLRVEKGKILADAAWESGKEGNA